MLKKWHPGINHIEYWVSNLEKSIPFYDELFRIIGWRKLNQVSYSTGSMEIYFKETEAGLFKNYGPRHICFQAVSKEVVDEVGAYLHSINAKIIRGPVEITNYSEGYYTIDFYDPDGSIFEVAYTPNMEL